MSTRVMEVTEGAIGSPAVTAVTRVAVGTAAGAVTLRVARAAVGAETRGVTGTTSRGAARAVTRAVAALAGGLLAAGLLTGCGVVGGAPTGTDPAPGAFDGLGGPASSSLPGALPGAAPDASAGAAPAATELPTVTATPAPAPAATVPRQSAALSSQLAPVSAPVRVRSEALGIDMSVEAEGLGDDGAMGLPANPAVAGWYRYGAGPGSPAGATVIAAHVDSLAYDIGPFAALATAPAGTEIVLETADGGTHRYSVASVDSQKKPEVPWANVFDRTGTPRLTLVTCGGEFDYEARRYLSNVIVTAVPAP